MAFYSNRVSVLFISTVAFLGTGNARADDLKKRRLQVVTPATHLSPADPLLVIEAAPAVRLVVPVGTTSQQTVSLVIDSQPEALKDETQLEVAWMKAMRDPRTKNLVATDVVAGGTDVAPALWEAKPADFDLSGKTYLIAEYKLRNSAGSVVDRGERVFELVKREVAPLPENAFDVPTRAMPMQTYRLQTKMAQARAQLRPGDRWEVEWTKGMRDPHTRTVYMTGLISRTTDKVNATWRPEFHDFDQRGQTVILANYRIYDEHDNVVAKGLHTFDVAKINPPAVVSVQRLDEEVELA